MSFDLNIITQKIDLSLTSDITLYLRREDLIHPFVSGNKYRKLKYNIIEAKNQNQNTLLTFGGAFSNHIAAVSAAGKLNNLKTIGIIRGEELTKKPLNSTLKYAVENGMKLQFVTRKEYKEKQTEKFIANLTHKHGPFYLIPEGGTNTLAIKGCKEILSPQDDSYNYICTPVGTGGTVAGIINASNETQKVLGFSALNGNFLNAEIERYVTKNNWLIITDYTFGGYAKVNIELINFINDFNKKHHIALDPVYTGKMIYGILKMIQKQQFPKGSKILAIHTGGLQGITGINEQLKLKKLPLIKI